MTNAQVVALGIRLFCIWLAIYLLRQAPALWIFNTREAPETNAAFVVIAVSAVLVVVIILLWRFPLTVARKLLPTATLDQPTSYTIDQLQSAAFCILGLWILTEAIPHLVYTSVIVYHSTRPNAMVTLEPRNFAAMAQMLAELVLGIWLLFGGKGLLGLIRWARYGGTAEPSNPALNTDAQTPPRAG